MAWNGSDGAAESRGEARSPRSVWRGAAAGGIVAAAALVAVLMLRKDGGDESAVKESPQTRQIAEVQPAAAAKRAQPEASKQDRAAALFAKTNSFVKTPGKMLTPDGRVLTFPVPKPGEFRTVHSHGRVYRCDSEGNFEDVTPKPVFDNAFENNLLGMAIEGGAFIPGMLTGHDKGEIAAMLTRPVTIGPDDPPDVVEKKEAVAALKSDIIDYIKEGGTFDDYVMAMRKQSADERMLKGMATKEIVQMLKDGKGAEAAAFCDMFNEKYGKEGMRPLKLPRHIKEILDNNRE